MTTQRDYLDSKIYYDDGGHAGPFPDFHAAYAYAVRVLKGSRTTGKIEIRPPAPAVIGGYASGHKDSFYVTKSAAQWSSVIA